MESFIRRYCCISFAPRSSLAMVVGLIMSVGGRVPAQADVAANTVPPPTIASPANEPVVQSAPTPLPAWPATAKVKIALAGDSTVTDNAGWGTGFEDLLQPGAAVINMSRGGRSSKSFIAEGLWAKTLSLKPDYVLIQFGHNDQPGHGPDRETDPATTYPANITKYVLDAESAGIQPVLVTPLTRRTFGPDGKIHSTLAPYADAVRKVAAEQHVPLIDLQALSIDYFNSLGPTGWQILAPKKATGYDGTHLNHDGSEVVGKMVVDALVAAVPALKDDFKSTDSTNTSGNQ